MPIEIETKDINCVVCQYGDYEDQLMLCDGCDRGFHSYCLNISAVPIADWYCSGCLIKNKAHNNDFKLAPRSVVYLYERISSKGQDNPLYGRVGLDTQNNSLLQFALNTGLIIKSTIREIESAFVANDKRLIAPSLRKIKKDECLVVYSVSRFSRNLQEGMEMLRVINKNKAYVYSILENVYSYEDKFIELLKNAEEESKSLSLKIKTAHNRIKLLGGYIGKAPFGYRVYRDTSGIRKIEQDPEEQKIIDLIKKNKPSQILLDNLTKKYSYRGKPWTISIIKRLYSKHSSTRALSTHNKPNKLHIEMKNTKGKKPIAKKNSYPKLMKGFVKDLRHVIDNCESDNDSEMEDVNDFPVEETNNPDKKDMKLFLTKNKQPNKKCTKKLKKNE